MNIEYTYIPLGDTRYLLMKEYAIQNAIFRILVASLSSLICTS